MTETKHHTSTHNKNAATLMAFQGITKSFTTGTETVTALNNVSGIITKGALNIITGPSGSGKSTLLDILVGLQRPTSGTVLVDGIDIYKLGTDDRAYYRARMLGMVYQANYWVKSLNVIENVSMPLLLAGYDRHQAAELAKLSLESVGMANLITQNPINLSGGQQQRISMARALVANPEVIVADEPTGNLDTRNGSLIMDLLVAAVKEQSKTVVLVTHNLEYLPLGDKLFYIKDGLLSDNVTASQIVNNLGPLLTKEAKS